MRRREKKILALMEVLQVGRGCRPGLCTYCRERAEKILDQ